MKINGLTKRIPVKTGDYLKCFEERGRSFSISGTPYGARCNYTFHD